MNKSIAAIQEPMTVYILTNDWNNCSAGTKFFLQDGMYFYKTITENEEWLLIEEVENKPELFQKAQ